jgi:hypothetical protein
MAEIHPTIQSCVIQNSRSWHLTTLANRSFGLSSVVGFVNQRRPYKEEEPIVQRYSDWAKTGDPSEVDDPLKAPKLEAIYMLIAYAIENLLKGLMLAKGIAKFRGQKYPNKLVSHDLRKLHERAKPRATVSLHLLDALTYMSVWRARYPLPLKLQDFWPMDDKGNPKFVSLPASLDECWAYCDKLDEELKGYLSANDRAGIDDLAKP